MFDAIFLDCDGVVTNRQAQVDSHVVFEAYRLAHSGKKVAFVTGRSLDWFARSLIPELERLSPSPEERQRFFLVGEYGNRWATFSAGGLSTGSDDSHSISGHVRSLVRDEAGAHFPLIFFDETKESFISLEIRHGKLASPQAERNAQKQLDEARALFASRFPECTVVRTLYAVDIMAKGVDKASAARRALELMGSVSSALVIGDSSIDLEMGDELGRQGVKFDFYYVGETPPGRRSFTVRKTTAPYSEGALEVLRTVR